MLFLLRFTKNTESLLLALTFFLCTFALSSIFILTESIRLSLANNAASILGGDRAIHSPVPISDSIRQQAKLQGLKSADTITFLTMVFTKQNEDNLVLAEVKVIDAAYPLRGNLLGKRDKLENEITLSAPPDPGTVWVEENVLNALNASIGDAIQIGSAIFTIKGLITLEPDRGSEGITLAPRILMNTVDLDKTGTQIEGSRQNYRLLLAGNKAAIELAEKNIKPLLSLNQSFISAEDTGRRLGNYFGQAQNYLHFVLIINFILVVFTLLQVARKFASDQYSMIALLRCFGIAFKQIYRRYVVEILGIGFFSGLLGFILAWSIIYFNQGRLRFLFPEGLKIAWLLPCLLMFFIILLLMYLFIFPSLQRLKEILPVQIFRKNVRPELTINRFSAWLKWKLNSSLEKAKVLTLPLRYGIANMCYMLWDTGLQVLTLTFIIGSACILYFLGNDLISTWMQDIKQGTPNYFVININPQDKDNFYTILKDTGIGSPKLYPILKARLLSVNNQRVDLTPKPDTTRLFARLLNITYDTVLPEENEIVAGTWAVSLKVAGDNAPVVQFPISVDQDFAARLDIHLQDRLEFQLENKNIIGVVSSIRKVNWDSMHPNFYVIFQTERLDAFQPSFITSFYLPQEKVALIKTLHQKFPSINVLDMSTLLHQAFVLLRTLSNIIYILWAFTFLMALLFLICTLRTHFKLRIRQAGILKALGNARKVPWIILSEFFILGGFAGLLALIISVILYQFWIRNIFKLHFHFNGILIVLIPLFSSALVGLIAVLTLQKIWKLPPRTILQR